MKILKVVSEVNCVRYFLIQDQFKRNLIHYVKLVLDISLHHRVNKWYVKKRLFIRVYKS